MPQWVMQERSSKPKRPRDPNQLAKFIVDMTTGAEMPEAEAKPEKHPAAVALGRLGGLKGGVARAVALTADRKREIATKAAAARWKKQG